MKFLSNNLSGKYNLKTIIEICGIAIAIISLIFIYLQTKELQKQNKYIFQQTKELQKQTEDIQQGLKQEKEFNRLEFIYKNSDSLLGSENNKIKNNIRGNLEIGNNDLLSWIDNFEVIADLYYDKKLINDSELNIYFGTYITNTCKHKNVISYIKTNSGHNGLKNFCYCKFKTKTGLSSTVLDVYKTNCGK